MKEIRLNGIALSAYNAQAVLRESKIALSNSFSMPKRIGVTERIWKTSTEAYVSKEDIRLAKQDISLTLATTNVTLQLISALRNCTEISNQFDTFKVKQTGDISEEIFGKFSLLKVDFQSEYKIAKLTVTPSSSGTFQISGYDLYKDFKMTVKTKKELIAHKRVTIKSENGNDYADVDYREAYDIQIEGFFFGDNLSEIYNRVRQFQAMIISPGTKELVRKDRERKTIYVKDGMQCVVVAANAVEFNMKLRVI